MWLYRATGPDLLGNGNATRIANISKGFLLAVGKFGGKTPSPLEILAYIYAVLYSPSYRCRYGDFIRRNYPRVPLTSDRKLFEKLVGFGSDLIQLHLFRTAPPVTSTYPVAGSNVVSAAKFELASAPGIGRIRINKTQFIDGVATTVWDLQSAAIKSLSLRGG